MIRAAALCLMLAGCSRVVGHGDRGGGGIVSTNPCADALLVRLVAPARIAAISHYSQDAAATSISLAVARRFRATAGTAEEVIALHPTLVIASTFTPAATRDAYARAELQVAYLDSPVTVAASVAQVRNVAAAVGEGVKGEAMARRSSRRYRFDRAPVIPAQAGIQNHEAPGFWTPACAGVTKERRNPPPCSTSPVTS